VCELVYCRIPHSDSVSVFHLYSLSVAWCGTSIDKTGRYLYTFIYIIHNVYTSSLFVHVRSPLSLIPISPIFFHCIRTRGPLANRRAGLLRLAVSLAAPRGWRRRWLKLLGLTPSPYIFHYILPHSLSSHYMWSIGTG